MSDNKKTALVDAEKSKEEVKLDKFRLLKLHENLQLDSSTVALGIMVQDAQKDL